MAYERRGVKGKNGEPSKNWILQGFINLTEELSRALKQMYDHISILDKLLFIKVNTRTNTMLEGMEASKVAL